MSDLPASALSPVPSSTFAVPVAAAKNGAVLLGGLSRHDLPGWA